jgi:hypothetical protein
LIQVFSATGAYLGEWGGWGDASSTGKFYYSNSVAVSPSGSVYVADELNHRIQQFKLDSVPANLPEHLFLPLLRAP